MLCDNKMEEPTNQFIKLNEIPHLKTIFSAILISINESNKQSKNAVKVLEQLFGSIQDKSDELQLSFSEVNGQMAISLKSIHDTYNCLQRLGNKVIEIEINTSTNDDDPLDISDIKFEEHVNSFSSIKEEVSQEENSISINNTNMSTEKDLKEVTTVEDTKILSYNKENFVKMQPDKQSCADISFEQIIKCDLCNYTTCDARYYKQHKQLKHTEGKYKCELCAFKAHRPYVIKDHMKRKHDIVDVKYLVDSKDPNIKYFHCPYCYSNTPHGSQDDLNLHILKKHPSNKLNHSEDDSTMETDEISNDIFLIKDSNPDLNFFKAENQDDIVSNKPLEEVNRIRDSNELFCDIGDNSLQDEKRMKDSNELFCDTGDNSLGEENRVRDSNELFCEEDKRIKDNSDLFCNIGDSSIKDPRLLEHYKNWKDGHKFRCDGCDFTAYNSGLVKKHMKINCDHKKYLLKVDKTDPDKKILLCYAYKCQFKCLSLTKMEAHVTLKHGIKEEINEMENCSGNNYQCNRCNFTTNKKVLFDDHLNGNIKYWKCPWCDIYMVNGARKRKREHLTLKHNIKFNGLSMICCYCDKSVTKFAAHLAVHHSIGVEHHCPKCDYSSINRKGWIQHTSMNHKLDEHPCQHCGKIFQNEQKLNKHICYYHTAVQCDVCSNTFDNRNKLYEHKKKQSWHKIYIFF